MEEGEKFFFDDFSFSKMKSFPFHDSLKNVVWRDGSVGEKKTISQKAN
jgi:hypothetical protein